MRKSFQKFSALFMILLIVGSFILHPGVHDCGCIGNTHIHPQKTAGPVLLADEPGTDLLELFCPVCAGMLTSDCPESFDPVLPEQDTPVIPAGRSAELAWIRQLLPSPRAPPKSL